MPAPRRSSPLPSGGSHGDLGRSAGEPRGTKNGDAKGHQGGCPWSWGVPPPPKKKGMVNFQGQCTIKMDYRFGALVMESMEDSWRFHDGIHDDSCWLIVLTVMN